MSCLASQCGFALRLAPKCILMVPVNWLVVTAHNVAELPHVGAFGREPPQDEVVESSRLQALVVGEVAGLVHVLVRESFQY